MNNVLKVCSIYVNVLLGYIKDLFNFRVQVEENVA
jgi:hypothetical protein